MTVGFDTLVQKGILAVIEVRPLTVLFSTSRHVSSASVNATWATKRVGT
jgi:hypothetical protein